MNEILPGLLWLGHAGHGRDYRKLFDTGVKALVELAAEEPPSQPPRELIYCRFPVLDGPGNDLKLLALATRTVATLLHNQVPTLVCCSGGMSRSPAVTAAALALLQEEPPEECLQRITAHHPSDVSPGLWSEIIGYLSSVPS
jgi:hypothetical protein